METFGCNILAENNPDVESHGVNRTDLPYNSISHTMELNGLHQEKIAKETRTIMNFNPNFINDRKENH